MKKISLFMVTLMMAALVMTGCGTKSTPEESPKKSESDAANKKSESDAAKEAKNENDRKETKEKVYRIGICQFVQHEALDSAYKGFVDGLKEAGLEEGKNLELDYKNANGEQANCTTIATKFVNDRDDLILAIATQAAQACANATMDIPILLTAVTDPKEAGMVTSNEAPGGNVTGTSDLTPVEEQIELLKKIIPDAKKIGILYCSSEINSKIQADMAKEKAKTMGIKTVEATVSNSNEIQQVVQNLVGKVDAIYAPTDNVIAAGMETVALITTPNKIPVICGESGMLDGGGLATYGINYYNLGKQTAQQAVKILKEGADPAKMPIEYLKDIEFAYNEEIAKEIGVKIPEDLK